MVHSDGQQFFCDLCGGRFALERKLRAHIVQLHMSALAREDTLSMRSRCGRKQSKQNGSRGKQCQRQEVARRIEKDNINNLRRWVRDDPKRELRIVLTRCDAVMAYCKDSKREEIRRESSAIGALLSTCGSRLYSPVKAEHPKNPKHEHVDIEDDMVTVEDDADTRKPLQVKNESKNLVPDSVLVQSLQAIATDLSGAEYLPKTENDLDEVSDCDDIRESLMESTMPPKCEPPIIEDDTAVREALKNQASRLIGRRSRSSSPLGAGTQAPTEFQIDSVHVRVDRKTLLEDSSEGDKLQWGNTDNPFNIEFEATTKAAVKFEKLEPTEQKHDDSCCSLQYSQPSDSSDENNIIAKLHTMGDKQHSKLKNHAKFYCRICKKNMKFLDKYKIHMKEQHPCRKLYPCSTCGRKYSKKYLLRRHALTHSGKEVLFCDICGMSYVFKIRLARHIKHKHLRAPRLFYCDICNKSFPTKHQVAHHIQVHSSDKLFSCKLCNAKFKIGNNLQRHMSLHENNKAYPCNVCGEKFTTGERLTGHMGLHTGEKAFSCKTCDKAYRTKASLNRHIREHTGDKLLSCWTCGQESLTRIQLEEHEKKHRNERSFTCDTCGKTIKRKDSLSIHMMQHNGENQFPCEICGKKFPAKYQLGKHMKNMHPTKPLPCEFCDKRFGVRSKLEKHMTTHTKERPHSCQICGKSFAHKYYLNNHTKLHQRDRLYSCSVCNKNFVSKKNLDEHMGLHADEKPFSCDHCGRSYLRKFALIDHLLTHEHQLPLHCKICDERFRYKVELATHVRTHSQKNLPCSICGKNFVQGWGMKKHMQTHNGEDGEALLTCKVCGKRMKEKKTLISHMMIHTGEQPFECADCGKKFSLKQNMIPHVLTHIGEKPFSCKICGSSFVRKYSLKLHMKTHSRS